MEEKSEMKYHPISCSVVKLQAYIIQKHAHAQPTPPHKVQDVIRSSGITKGRR